MRAGYLGVIALAKRKGSKKNWPIHFIDEYDEKVGWGTSPCGCGGEVFITEDQVTCWRCKRWPQYKKRQLRYR